MKNLEKLAYYDRSKSNYCLCSNLWRTVASYKLELQSGTMPAKQLAFQTLLPARNNCYEK